MTATRTPNFFSRMMLALAAVVAAMPGWADEFNMPIGVTDISRQVYDLHMLIFYICVAIGVVVFGVMIWSMLHHRKSHGAVPATFHESTKVELAWTIIPTLILILMAIPATRVLVQMYDTGGEDMQVEVRGYQWKWEYKYLDQQRNKVFSFMSNLSTPMDEINDVADKGEHYLLEVDEPLRIPVNRKVRFLITSNDVIHAWWVPDFGIKRDAVPGMLNELWAIVEEPGVYRGQCTELCGKDHGFMPVVVQAMPEDEYDAWYASRVTLAAEQKKLEKMSMTHDELMAKGAEVYTKYCASCHQENGKGIPPAFPALDGSAIAVGPVDDHIGIILYGKPGTAMQAFENQLRADEIAAVTHYERHAWGNNTDDIVQPIDVANLKNKEG